MRVKLKSLKQVLKENPYICYDEDFWFNDSAIPAIVPEMFTQFGTEIEVTRSSSADPLRYEDEDTGWSYSKKWFKDDVKISAKGD